MIEIELIDPVGRVVGSKFVEPTISGTVGYVKAWWECRSRKKIPKLGVTATSQGFIYVKIVDNKMHILLPDGYKF